MRGSTRVVSFLVLLLVICACVGNTKCTTPCTVKVYTTVTTVRVHNMVNDPLRAGPLSYIANHYNTCCIFACTAVYLHLCGSVSHCLCVLASLATLHVIEIYTCTHHTILTVHFVLYGPCLC